MDDKLDLIKELNHLLRLKAGPKNILYKRGGVTITNADTTQAILDAEKRVPEMADLLDATAMTDLEIQQEELI